MFQNGLHMQSLKRLISDSFNRELQETMATSTSLIHFNLCKKDTSMSSYLNVQHSFKAIQTKFKLRTGTAGIGEDLARQHRGSGMCHCGDYESLKHLIFNCRLYSNARTRLYLNIRDSYGIHVFNDLLQNPCTFLYRLLGQCDDHFNMHFLSFIDDVWKIRTHIVPP